jgi:hypothetical protein
MRRRRLRISRFRRSGALGQAMSDRAADWSCSKDAPEDIAGL